VHILVFEPGQGTTATLPASCIDRHRQVRAASIGWLRGPDCCDTGFGQPALSFQSELIAQRWSDEGHTDHDIERAPAHVGRRFHACVTPTHIAA